ncbi:hypothetical protein EON64_04720 [archaeon]|nr:MAG: hypothetical protein EON64_04720 [archaeon]
MGLGVVIAGKNARADFPEERLPPAARREMEKRFRNLFGDLDRRTIFGVLSARQSLRMNGVVCKMPSVLSSSMRCNRAF